MAARIFILAFAAVIWKAQSQQCDAGPIYVNPLRPPFAEESPIFINPIRPCVEESSIYINPLKLTCINKSPGFVKPLRPSFVTETEICESSSSVSCNSPQKPRLCPEKLPPIQCNSPMFLQSSSSDMFDGYPNTAGLKECSTFSGPLPRVNPFKTFNIPCSDREIFEKQSCLSKPIIQPSFPSCDSQLCSLEQKKCPKTEDVPKYFTSFPVTSISPVMCEIKPCELQISSAGFKTDILLEECPKISAFTGNEAKFETFNSVTSSLTPIFNYCGTQLGSLELCNKPTLNDASRPICPKFTTPVITTCGPEFDSIKSYNKPVLEEITRPSFCQCFSCGFEESSPKSWNIPAIEENLKPVYLATQAPRLPCMPSPTLKQTFSNCRTTRPQLEPIPASKSRNERPCFQNLPGYQAISTPHTISILVDNGNVANSLADSLQLMILNDILESSFDYFPQYYTNDDFARETQSSEVNAVASSEINISEGPFNRLSSNAISSVNLGLNTGLGSNFYTEKVNEIPDIECRSACYEPYMPVPYLRPICAEVSNVCNPFNVNPKNIVAFESFNNLATPVSSLSYSAENDCLYERSNSFGLNPCGAPNNLIGRRLIPQTNILLDTGINQFYIPGPCNSVYSSYLEKPEQVLPSSVSIAEASSSVSTAGTFAKAQSNAIAETETSYSSKPANVFLPLSSPQFCSPSCSPFDPAYLLPVPTNPCAPNYINGICPSIPFTTVDSLVPATQSLVSIAESSSSISSGQSLEQVSTAASSITATETASPVSTSFAASDAIASTSVVDEVIPETFYPNKDEISASSSSYAVAESSSSVITSYDASEASCSEPNPEETITTTASASSTAETVTPTSSVSSTSTVTTSTVDKDIPKSPAQQTVTSTSSASSYIGPEVSDLISSPVTLDVQKPSFIDSSFPYSGFGNMMSYISSPTSSSKPVMYELQIPSCIPAQFMCSLV